MPYIADPQLFIDSLPRLSPCRMRYVGYRAGRRRPEDGEETLRGIVTVSLAGQGSFGVSNARIQCSGEYPFTPGQIAVNVHVTCSDGRTGTGTAVRTSSLGGSGTMRMSDGTEALFAYGPESALLSSRVAAINAVPTTPAAAEPAPASTAPHLPPHAARPYAPQAIDAATRERLKCLDQAVSALAGQPEPAETVVVAAFGSCGKEERLLQSASGGVVGREDMEEIKTKSARSRLLSEVLAIRAARQRLHTNPVPPQTFEYNRI